MTNQELLQIYSAYLPYAVDVLVDDGNGQYTDFITGIGGIDDMIFLNKTGDWYYDDVNDFTAKLILRPLSDLTKEILHNGERFVPMEWLQDKFYTLTLHEQCEMIIEDERWINQCDYILIQYLLEWHFDVFSLIDQNIAINLNEVK